MTFVAGNELMYIFRVFLACVCGGVIGIERQRRTKVAGIKTHMMISIAAALMMLISKYGFIDVMSMAGIDWDVSRVAAGIITGMGILSGGIICTSKQGYVSGITTAAGIWVTIGIGMAIGAGMYMIGIGTMLMVVIIQLLLHMNLKVFRKPTKGYVSFKLENDTAAFERIEKELATYKISMYQFKWERKGKNTILMRCQIVIPTKYDRDEMVHILMSIPELETFAFS